MTDELQKTKVEEIKIHVSHADMTDGVNLDGVKGKKCNYCGGYGYTMSLEGGRLDCTSCGKTGIEKETVESLTKRVTDLEKDMEYLRQAVIQTLSEGGFIIKEKAQEEIHA